MPLDEFPPAPGQGAICIETRIGDARIGEIVAPLHDAATAAALDCERAFLAALDGSCRTPIAGYARIEGDRLYFSGLILRPDGARSAFHRARRRGAGCRCDRRCRRRSGARQGRDRASSKAGPEWACVSWSRGRSRAPAVPRRGCKRRASSRSCCRSPRSSRSSRHCLPSSLAAVAVSSANAVRQAPAALLVAAGQRAGLRGRRRDGGGGASGRASRTSAAAPAMPPTWRAISSQPSGRRRGSPICAGACGSTRWRRSLPRRASRSWSSRPTTRAERAAFAGGAGANSTAAPVDAALVYSAKGAQSLAGLVAPRAGTIFRRHGVHLHLAAHRRESCRNVVSGSRALPPRRRMKMPCSTFLPRPGHEPAPFRTNVA